MLIAVVSDTHRMTKYINLAKRLIKDADILIHLGDNIDDAELLEILLKEKYMLLQVIAIIQLSIQRNLL